MLQIKQSHYDFLMKVFELACKRDPVQGSFSFETFNSVSPEPKTKENVPNCGTFGCIAGGYMPLVDSDYYFNSSGSFMYKQDIFIVCPLFIDNVDLARALFYPRAQVALDYKYFGEKLGLTTLTLKATKEEVLLNMKTILANLTVIPNV